MILFVIVLFSIFTSLAAGGTVTLLSFADIPVSILLGILTGCLSGWLLQWLLKWVKSEPYQVLLVLSAALLLCGLENILKGRVALSGLLAVMSMGITLQKCSPNHAKTLPPIFSTLWKGGEIMLFVLVGAAVNINYAAAAGLPAVFLIVCVLAIRMLGVACCLFKSDLSSRERLFCMIAYTPTAPVQAAIG